MITFEKFLNSERITTSMFNMGQCGCISTSPYGVRLCARKVMELSGGGWITIVLSELDPILVRVEGRIF